MKKIIIIIFSLFLISNTYSINIQELTDSALNCYKNGEYEQAINIYNNLYDSGYSSSELFYNLGNCYFKTNDIANSIYFYEKAKNLAPNDKDIVHNLKIANSRIKNKVEILPQPFYLVLFETISNIMTSNSWAICGIICFILTLLLIFIFLFSNKSLIKKFCFYIAVFTLIFSLYSIITSKYIAENIVNSNFGIVFSSVMVKSSPNEEGTNLFEIDKGLKVEIKDSLNSWKQIKLSDGKEGWIVGDGVKELGIPLVNKKLHYE